MINQAYAFVDASMKKAPRYGVVLVLEISSDERVKTEWSRSLHGVSTSHQAELLACALAAEQIRESLPAEVPLMLFNDDQSIAAGYHSPFVPTLNAPYWERLRAIPNLDVKWLPRAYMTRADELSKGG